MHNALWSLVTESHFTILKQMLYQGNEWGLVTFIINNNLTQVSAFNEMPHVKTSYIMLNRVNRIKTKDACSELKTK